MIKENQTYDTLVIGGGIAGQEAALNLANLDYKVLLVDKALSIGGKMMRSTQALSLPDEPEMSFVYSQRNV